MAEKKKKKSKYRRVLLKASGQMLQGKKRHYNIDPKIVEIFLEIEEKNWANETKGGANNAPPPDKR